MYYNVIAPNQLGPKKSGWIRIFSDNPVVALDLDSGAHIQQIICCKDSREILYDQPIICAPPGAVTLPVDERGRIGLQENWPPCIHPDYREEYKTCLGCNKNLQLNKDLEYEPRIISDYMFGRTSFEAPHTFVDFGKCYSTNAYVSRAWYLGEIIPSTKYVAQSNLAYVIKFDFTQQPESISDKEKDFLDSLQFFDCKQVKDLQQEEKLFCGSTLSILQMLSFNDPEWAAKFYAQ